MIFFPLFDMLIEKKFVQNSWHKRYDLLIQITEKVQEGPLKKVGWPHFGNGFKMS